MVKAVR